MERGRASFIEFILSYHSRCIYLQIRSMSICKT